MAQERTDHGRALDPGWDREAGLEPALSDSDIHDVLALRGLLGMGVLASTLRLRSRVDFGIDKRRVKRLAVPYRANDTPSERAEFAHMDRSLLLAHLAHYDVGLSEEQLREAIGKLQRMGKGQRDLFYGRWLRAARAGMTSQEQEQLQDEGRLDLTNAAQWRLLCRLYLRNIETINFWLAMVVLPDDTAQFDRRLTATPWMLVDGRVGRGRCGFSGTNDNNLVLPLQMRPVEPTQDSPLRALGATNGRMMDYLVKHGLEVTVVGGKVPASNDEAPATSVGQSGQSQQKALWQQVLTLAVERGRMPSSTPGRYWRA